MKQEDYQLIIAVKTRCLVQTTLIWLQWNQQQITSQASCIFFSCHYSTFWVFISIIHNSDVRIVWRRLVVIFKVFCIVNKRECHQRKHFSADDNDFRLRMILMKSASNLHSKSADRASWSLIFFWSKHWMNDKNKAHDDNYDLLARILFAMVWVVLYLLRLCSNEMICVKKVWRDRSKRLVYKYDWKHSVS